jgi:hypothetical protein
MDAGHDRLTQTVDVAVMPKSLAIGQQQVEAGTCGCKALAKVLCRLLRENELRNQRPAAGGFLGWLAPCIAVIGNQCKAIVVPQCHPAAACLQIPTAQNGQVWPGGDGCGGARMKFITVGNQQQRPFRIGINGNSEQTHIPSGFICGQQSLI